MTRIFDLTKGDCVNPIEAVYASSGNSCLVKVPLDRIVTFNYSAFSLGINGKHPFVRTLKAYEENSQLTAKASPLRWFYDLYQPATASELMDIPRPSYSAFLDLPPLASLPLSSWLSPEKYCEYIKSIYQREDTEQGVKLDEFIGGSQFGPIEPRKLFIEYRRLTHLYDSIKSRGYKPQTGEWMTGTAWIDEKDWVVMVSTGQHRIACLAALGHESAVVRLQPKKAPGGLMLKSFSRHFPSVVNGFHTEEEALAIFDRIISKKSPRVASDWIDYCINHLSLPCVEK
ncbi:hypothetical protein [Halomonas korlensis]|nr:hypothetical protein [Halomonas korlensis]